MRPFRTVPSLRQRVWGGARLTPPGSPPIGEAWLVGPDSQVPGAGGEGEDLTVDDLVARHGVDLVGTAAPDGPGFPLLVKLLDPAEWLSVQVHPNDEQALRLEGPGAVGKTEGWYFIEAEPEAAILLGTRPTVSPEAVLAGLRTGRVADLLQRREVRAGEAYLVPAGTLHAVGPGALVYEIQQASDITYRCDDWGRPATAGRTLHTRQSIEVASLVPWKGEVASSAGPGPSGTLLHCPLFVLEHLCASGRAGIERDTHGTSAHILTAVQGSVLVRGRRWTERLVPRESLVIPAAVGPYEVEGEISVASAAESAGDAPRRSLVLVARLPDASGSDADASPSGSPVALRPPD